MKGISVLFLLMFPLCLYADILDYEAMSSAGTGRQVDGGHKTKPIVKYGICKIGKSPSFWFYIENGNTEKWVVDVAVTAELPPEAGYGRQSIPIPDIHYYSAWPDRKIVAKAEKGIFRSSLLKGRDEYRIHLASAAYAARYTARAYFTSNENGYVFRPCSREGETGCMALVTNILDMKVPDLAAMPRNDRVYTIGKGTPLHAEANYASTGTISALSSIASAWKTDHSWAELLSIGKMSLPWGGEDPREPGWKGHGMGIAADIDVAKMQGTERAALLKLLCGNGFIVRRERSEPGYFHILQRKELMARADGGYAVNVAEEKAGDCCAPKFGAAGDTACARP